MKKLFPIFLCILPLLCNAQSIKIIQLTYTEDDFFYEQTEYGYRINSSIHYLTFEADTLKPAIPYININVLLDSDKEYDGFTFSFTDSLVRSNFTLAPNKIDTANEPIPAPINSYPNGIYPSTLIELGGTYTMGGYRCVSFLVSPYRYDSYTQCLYLNTSISINVCQRQSGNSPQNAPTLHNPIINIVINSGDINLSYGSTNIPTEYEYIIITNDTLKPLFQTLADWKTTKGIRAKVLTTEEIGNTYAGETLQLKIKSAIKDYYDGQYKGLKYVLLGGDVGIVPTQMCVIKYCSETDTTPTDWFYACLDNIGWDTNGNEIVGEIEDSIDIAADLIISRLSVNTSDEANSIIRRIIEYEQHPNTENWEDKILLCGNTLSSKSYINGILKSDAQQYGEKLYNEEIAPYWEGQHYYFYDTGSDFEGGGNYDFTVENFQSELSNGYTFVDINTHGYETLFRMETTPPYRNSDALQLTNVGNTIFFSHACTTNAFDCQESCLSECLMRNPNSGILSYVGSSRLSWVFTMHQLSRKFYCSLLKGNSHHIGEAFITMKNQTIGNCYRSNKADRWMLFALNLLGDPEMPVFLNQPQKFENVSLTSTNTSITINTGIDGCQICCTNAIDDEDVYFEVWDSVRYATFNNIPNDIKICITKTGYIPYIFTFSKAQYIQNETFTENSSIFANEVYIGSNVTLQKEQGPVYIKNGKTSIKSTKGVTIKNDFDIKRGASLDIVTGNL